MPLNVLCMCVLSGEFSYVGGGGLNKTSLQIKLHYNLMSFSFPFLSIVVFVS